MTLNTPVADLVVELVARFGNSDALGYPLTWCRTNAEVERFKQLIQDNQ